MPYIHSTGIDTKPFNKVAILPGTKVYSTVALPGTEVSSLQKLFIVMILHKCCVATIHEYFHIAYFHRPRSTVANTSMLLYIAGIAIATIAVTIVTYNQLAVSVRQPLSEIEDNSH